MPFKMVNNMFTMKLHTNLETLVIDYLFFFQVSIFNCRVMTAILWVLVMADIQDGWQYDSWSKMEAKGPLHQN